MPTLRISEETRQLYDLVVELMIKRSIEALGEAAPLPKYSHDAVIRASLESYLEVFKRE